MTNPLIGPDAARGGKPAIGEDGVLAFIDEINERRARRGDRERYKPAKVDGVLTGVDCLVPLDQSPYTPSPTYSRPRLVHSS